MNEERDRPISGLRHVINVLSRQDLSLAIITLLAIILGLATPEVRKMLLVELYKVAPTTNVPELAKRLEEAARELSAATEALLREAQKRQEDVKATQKLLQDLEAKRQLLELTPQQQEALRSLLPPSRPTLSDTLRSPDFWVRSVIIPLLFS